MNQFYLGLLWASVGYLIEVVGFGLDPALTIVAGTVAALLVLVWDEREQLTGRLDAEY